MARAFYHEHPDILQLETDVLDAAPGKVLLAQSPFFPGGGGQLADRGVLCWQHGEVAVTGLEKSGGRLWHVLADPQARHREMVVEMEDGKGRRQTTLGNPVKLSATPPTLRTPSPQLGEHTDTVLAGLGYSPGDVAGLRERGVV